MNIKGLVLVICALFLYNICLAAPAPQQEAGGQEKTRQMQEQEEELRKKIEKAPQAPQITQEQPSAAQPQLESEQKILINKINVTGVTLLSEKEVKDVISAFENREVVLKDLQKAADMLTDIYRRKGYITSRAYLPPQKIENNLVEIRIIEGLMGDVIVKGNKYFKPDVFKKRIGLRKGEPFNYNILRANLSKINQYDDRSAKAILTPGKEPGSTDVALEVKDRSPVHISFDWDNFGSRYIDRHRYQTILTHNNLLGFDDILALQYQFAENHDLQEQHDRYRLASLKYIFPISDIAEIGFYAANSKLTLGREFESLQARGKSQIYSLYTSYALINEENLTINLNAGIDYKDVINFQSGAETSRDRMRILKGGINWDRTDNNGRTIINNELSFGIPGIWGALGEQDSRASRSGSGGKFTKNTLDILRLQKMPFSSLLLIKNQNQITPYILTATEQFQLGGIVNVRGYPSAEFVGDKGSTITGEWSFPPYPVSKTLKVPLSQTTVYDALRFTAFYDWGNVRRRRPETGEGKYKTARSAGLGLRINLIEDFTARIDFAWPIDQTPSDGHHLHTWIKISKGF